MHDHTQHAEHADCCSSKPALTEQKNSHKEHAGHDGHEAHHDHTGHHEAMARDFKRRFFIALIVSIPVLALSPSIQQWFGFGIAEFAGYRFVLFGLASVIALYCAWPFYAHARGEIKEKELGMMTLVSIAVLSGYLYSVAATFFIDAQDFYWEISTLALVLLLGHWLEMRAVVGTAGALGELVKLIPPKANRINKDGSIEAVETVSLVAGDVILVKPGEKVPIDGDITEGESSVNESLITGESKPVQKKTGDAVIGGSLNTDGALTVTVTKTGNDTALAQIVELVRGAQASRPRSQKIADRAAHWLTIIAIVVGAGTFVTWNFWVGSSFVFALTLAITVVVITCPHALGLAIPVVTTITTTLAAKNGILIKNMDGLERARDVEWILFDKTGTLTSGEFGVAEALAFDGDEKMLLAQAAALESRSEHTIARSIVDHALLQNLKLEAIMDFKAIAGGGVVGKVHTGDGGVAELAVGTAGLMQKQDIRLEPKQVEAVALREKRGETVIYVGRNGTLAGILALSDTAKDESKQAIQELKKLGKQIAMITGDNEQVAQSIARELGIDTVFARVLPEDKVNKVKELQYHGAKVMMVGDGVNDAPALTQADVGVAIGAGTDVAAASAEIILVKNNPLDVVKLVTLSGATMVKMKQNLAWATGYNVIAIPVAAGALAHWHFFLRPEWGAIAMTFSSVIVVINALLLRRARL